MISKTKKQMLMRKVCFILSLAAFCIGGKAQDLQQNAQVPQLPTRYQWKVEASAGVCCSVLDTDVSGLAHTSYNVRPGFTAGVAAEYNIIENLAIGAGIHFVQRDYLYQNQGGDSWNTRYNNKFLSIPLTVGYYLLHNPYKEKGLWIKPQVGVFYDYFLSMHTKGTYPMNIMEGHKGDGSYIKYNTTYDFKKNENHLCRSLFGGEAGIQVGYSFGRIDASVGYQFQYGFSHIYQDKARTSKTARRNSSVITAGAAYKF